MARLMWSSWAGSRPSIPASSRAARTAPVSAPVKMRISKSSGGQPSRSASASPSPPRPSSARWLTRIPPTRPPTGAIGTLLSAGFLYLIAALNLIVLSGIFKIYYNLVITGLSIGAAFIIGTIEILGILTTEVHLNGGFWDLRANFNINLAGFCIAGLFIIVWAVALTY